VVTHTRSGKRAGQASLLAVSLMPALMPPAVLAGTVSGTFDVNINLLAPPGCTTSTGSGGQGGGAQVTLTCGANLLVNVRPVVVSAGGSAGDAQSPAVTQAGPGGADGTAAGAAPSLNVEPAAGGPAPLGSGPGAAPPGEGAAGDAPAGDDSPGPGSVQFRYSVAAAGAGDRRMWSQLRTALARQMANQALNGATKVEMWLDF
jgi:hypothetical protein